MSNGRLRSISAAAMLLVSAALASADDITAKKIFIKDNSDTTKRLIMVLSKDTAVTFGGADTPTVGGAAIHVYSATDDFCAILPSGSLWKNQNSKWKFVDSGTKNTAQVKDGRLLVKIKQDTPPITYSLADNAPPGQGTVNVQVQFGTGTRYCLRCAGNIKDDANKFLGKDCAAAGCDAEPSTCDPPNPTTTTSTSSTSSTTSTCPPGPPASPAIVKGALPPTAGRFNYNMAFGLPAANSFCNANFAGTHACTFQELQNAAAACELTSLTDLNAMTVTTFWAIDNAQPALSQCNDDGMVGSFLNWEYQTAHTGSRGNFVDLNNVTGILGTLQTGQQCNFTTKWVGCCMP